MFISPHAPPHYLGVTMEWSMSVDQPTLRSFFGHIPSGVLAVGAVVDSQPVGMAVSSFTNVSIDPPLITISIRNESETWPLLRQARSIGGSILAEQHTSVGTKLSKGLAHQRLSDVAFTASDNDAIFIENAAAWFEGVSVAEIPAGDHSLVLVQVQRLATNADSMPLIFHKSKFAGIRHD